MIYKNIEMPALLSTAEDVYDAWFQNDEFIDWVDFMIKLETHSNIDLGDNMKSTKICQIIDHINIYRHA